MLGFVRCCGSVREKWKGPLVANGMNEKQADSRPISPLSILRPTQNNGSISLMALFSSVGILLGGMVVLIVGEKNERCTIVCICNTIAQHIHGHWAPLPHPHPRKGVKVPNPPPAGSEWSVWTQLGVFWMLFYAFWCYFGLIDPETVIVALLELSPPPSWAPSWG